MLRPEPPRQADRVVVVAGSEYDHRHHKQTPPLLVEESADAIQRLWDQVTDWEPGSQQDAALMEPVRITLAFLSGRSPVVSVGLKSSTATSAAWDNWDRHLRTSAIYDWLRQHGIDLDES